MELKIRAHVYTSARIIVYLVSTIIIVSVEIRKRSICGVWRAMNYIQTIFYNGSNLNTL